jgi:hypothetical protein
MSKHKFQVGQLVELAPPLRRHTLGVYHIIALLPTEHGEPQYRVKSLAEANERCALEFELRAVTARHDE